jgi:hypothetical protein
MGQYVGPGPVSVYEQLDVHHYSKMCFTKSFRVEALSSESSMSIHDIAIAIEC